MHMLVVTEREGSMGEDMAQSGELAVPNFPTGMRNTFLGLDSFKPALYVKVRAIPSLKLDELADKLHSRFKALPRAVIDAYVLETAKVAQKLTLNALYQCYLDDEGEKVTLRNVKTGDVHTVWDRQPIPGGYR